MPARATKAKLTGHCSILPARFPLWISDEILHDTFARFCYGRKAFDSRSNSTVPGPLEASRRLSKRRVNNLCLGSNFLDAAPAEQHLSLGWVSRRIRKFFEEQPQWRWEPPATPHYQQTDTHKPLSLSDSIDPTKQPQVTENHVRAPQLSIGVAREEFRQPKSISIPEYENYLVGILGLMELRQLRNQCLHLRIDVVERSMAEFAQLLKAQATFSDMAEYLEDHTMNRARGYNMQRFIAHLSINEVTGEQCILVARKLREALVDKIFTEDERSRTLNMFATILFNTHGKDDPSAVLESYQIVLELPQPTSMETPVPDSILYQKVLQHLVDLPQASQTGFILVLLEHALPLHFVKLDPTSRTTLAKLSILLLQSRESRVSAPKTLSRVFDKLPFQFVERWADAIYSHLREAPETYNWQIRNDLIGKTLTAVQLSIHSPRDHNTEFWKHQYSTALSICAPSQLRDHFRRLEAQEHAFIILRHWLNRDAEPKHTYRLGHDRRSLASIRYTPVAASIESQMIRYKSHLPQLAAPVAWPVALVRALKHLGLSPHRVTQYYLEYFLAVKDYISFDTLAKCLRGFLGLRVPQDILHRFLHLQTTSAPTASLHLRLNKQLSVDNFPSVQNGLMHSSASRPRSIIHLLVGPARSKKRLTPVRIGMIRRAIIHFASDHRFNWARGYRGSRACINYLLKAGVKLDVEISHALVLVGLTRPLDKGIRLTRNHVRDVLRIVTLVEGEGAAARLKSRVNNVSHEWQKRYSYNAFWRPLD